MAGVVLFGGLGNQLFQLNFARSSNLNVTVLSRRQLTFLWLLGQTRREYEFNQVLKTKFTCEILPWHIFIILIILFKFRKPSVKDGVSFAGYYLGYYQNIDNGIKLEFVEMPSTVHRIIHFRGGDFGDKGYTYLKSIDLTKYQDFSLVSDVVPRDLEFKLISGPNWQADWSILQNSEELLVSESTFCFWAALSGNNIKTCHVERKNALCNFYEQAAGYCANLFIETV